MAIAEPAAALSGHFGADAEPLEFDEIRAVVDQVWSGPKAFFLDGCLVLTRREIAERRGASR
jgi:hypothetical protein